MLQKGGRCSLRGYRKNGTGSRTKPCLRSVLRLETRSRFTRSPGSVTSSQAMCGSGTVHGALQLPAPSLHLAGKRPCASLVSRLRRRLSSWQPAGSCRLLSAGPMARTLQSKMAAQISAFTEALHLPRVSYFTWLNSLPLSSPKMAAHLTVAYPVNIVTYPLFHAAWTLHACMPLHTKSLCIIRRDASKECVGGAGDAAGEAAGTVSLCLPRVRLPCRQLRSVWQANRYFVMARRWRELAHERAAALECNQAPQAIPSRKWPRCLIGVTHASWPPCAALECILGLVFLPSSPAPRSLRC